MLKPSYAITLTRPSPPPSSFILPTSLLPTRLFSPHPTSPSLLSPQTFSSSPPTFRSSCALRLIVLPWVLLSSPLPLWPSTPWLFSALNLTLSSPLPFSSTTPLWLSKTRLSDVLNLTWLSLILSSFTTTPWLSKTRPSSSPHSTSPSWLLFKISSSTLTTFRASRVTRLTALPWSLLFSFTPILWLWQTRLSYALSPL